MTLNQEDWNTPTALKAKLQYVKWPDYSGLSLDGMSKKHDEWLRENLELQVLISTHIEGLIAVWDAVHRFLDHDNDPDFHDMSTGQATPPRKRPERLMEWAARRARRCPRCGRFMRYDAYYAKWTCECT